MDILFPGRLVSNDLITSDCFDCHEAFGHGIFQWRLLRLGTLAPFLMNIHAFVVALISTNVEHWCKQPPASDISVDAWKNATFPADSEGRVNRCQLYEHPEDSNNTETIPGHEWVYDDPPARTTIV
ncbi:hypothetical protein V5799_000133, partial [Amblyomma americanum]